MSRLNRIWTVLIFTVASSSTFALGGCNGSGPYLQNGGTASFADPTALASDPPTSNPTPVPSAAFDSCKTNDPNHLCIALKYVVYNDSNGNPVVSSSSASKNITKINSVWTQCNIGFQIGNYLAVNPSDYRLEFNTANDSDLDEIRSKFDDNSSLLIVTTGAWDRSGSLGDTAANAWTNMPGDGIYGAILEAPVGTFSNIIAHEIGHYLNLLHVDDSSDLMNPIIYSDSTQLTSDQCVTVRSAVNSYWRKMVQ